MGKKEFISLADAITQNPKAFPPVTVQAPADWCAAQNPRFNRSRWLGYIAGTNGSSGGKVK